MKRSSSRLTLTALTFSVVLLAGVLVRYTMAQAKAPATKAPAKKSTVLKSAADLKWTDVPDVKGVQQAVLWGDPQKGPSGFLAKFKAGTEVGLHSHTADLRSVVISGTIVITVEGQAAKELGPGSYAYEPGGSKHTTACKAGADCMFSVQAAGVFDIVMAGASGGK